MRKKVVAIVICVVAVGATISGVIAHRRSYLEA